MEVKKQFKVASADTKISSTILNNNISICFLYAIVNACFSKDVVPAAWRKCVVKPILNSALTVPRDPLSHRGNALTYTVYKISVINEHLSI